ncbi:MAG: PAS domain S-box protein [Planctomycetes bacterium]|nr:PAS domain S-box protein [Planctomycetota bacterium]
MTEYLSEKPLLLRTRKNVIVTLRGIVFAIIYLILLQERGLHHLPIAFWVITLLFVISEFVYIFESHTHFLIQRILGWIFIFDAVLIGLAIYFLSVKSTLLFIAYFSVIAIAAISKSVRMAFIITFLISVFYLFLSIQQGNFIFTEFITRPLFFFGVAIFASYLSEESSTHRREQKKTEEMIKNIPYTGSYQSNFKGDFVYVTESFARMLEYDSPEELKSVDILKLYKNPEDRTRLMKELKRSGHVTGFEVELLTKTGKTKHLLINGILEGEIISGVNMDITEHKKAEKEIAMRSTLLDNATDSIFVHDENGRFIYANKAAYETRGYTKEEFMRISLADLDTPEYARLIPLRMKEISEKGSLMFEAAHRKKDGSIMPLEIHVSTIGLGGKQYFLSVLRDITERKKAEETLRKSEEHFRSLFNNMLNGFAYCRMIFENGKPKDFVCLDVNSAFESLTGLKNVVGKKVTALIPGIRESSPDIFEIYGRVALTGIPERFETYVEGLKMWFAVSVYSSQKEHFVAVFDVITERKLAEEKIRKSRDIEAAINSILKISLENIPLEDILRKTLDAILSIPWLSLQSCGAIFLTEGTDTLVMKTQNNIHPGLLEKCARIPFGKCVCGKAASSREIQFCDKINQEHETTYPGIIPHGHYCVPIVFNNKTLGVINLYIKEGQKQDEKEVELLSAIANTLTGIIQRKQAEKELVQNEEKFRSLVQNLSDIIIVMDDKMAVKYISPSVESILGYKPDDFIGKSPMDHVHPNDISSTAESFAETLKKPGINPPFNLRIRDKKGKWVCFETIGNNLLGNPVINGIVVTARDVTEQQRAHEEMHKLSNVVEQTADLVLITDKDGFIQYTNPAFEKLTGYKGKELAEGKTPRILKSERHDKTFYENMWRTILSGKPFSAEFTNRKKNGELYYEEKTITPVKDARGIITSFVSIGDDITAQKNMENQLMQSQKMEAVGSLAGGIAHDFNNILTTIQGYTDLVMEELDRQSPLYEDMEHIKNASRRATKLTHQLLLFSRKKPRELANIDINTIIDNMLPMLQRMIGENIKILPELAAGPSMIKADEGNIEQVLMNTVINARDAMSKGGIINLKTENLSIDEEYCKNVIQARPGEFICLSITDTGAGIDKGTISRIFEPFFTTKEKGKGTGLGLATVYGIVKQHQGWINVYSEPGHGTTFRVYLPVTKETTQTKKKSDIITPEKGNGEKILLVEDDDAIRDFTFKILSKNGYHVSPASMVKEALDIFLKEKGGFDLLLSDMVLPDKTGLELAEQLRTAKPNLPIIMSSGYTDNKIGLNGPAEKGYKFIQKPYNTLHLLKMIKETLISK